MMTPGSPGGPLPGEPDPFADPEEGSGRRLIGGMAIMLIGAAVFLGGIVLYVGEKADRLFLFPWAGRLTMLLGVVGLGLGAALAGRRAAMILSGLLVVGGIVLYVIGLIFVEQLGSRLYQAFGLLTALVGLISVYSVYGMDGVLETGGPRRRDDPERAR